MAKRTRIGVYLNTKQQQTAWKQDIAALQHALGIPTTSQTVVTTIHLAAQLAQKLMVFDEAHLPNVYRLTMPSTGESAYAYPGAADTWTLQIGPDPLNSVECLDSLDAAVALAMKAN